MTKTEQHSDREHAVLSASSSHRWMECPASIQACEGIDDSGSNIFAERGTAAHELGEQSLLQDKDTEEFIGEIYNKCELEPKGFVVDETMAENVQIYVNAVLAEMGPGKTLFVEKRFNLSWLHEGMFGTNDSGVDEPFGTLVIIDYKNGVGVVEVEDNSQLLYYALGAAEDNDYDSVKMMIVQPNASHIDGPVRSCTIPISKLYEFRDKLKAAALATEVKNPKFKAGDHCKWCPAAKGDENHPPCEAARKKVLEVTLAEFDPVENTDKTLTLPEPDSLTSTQLGRVLDMAEFINGWIKSIEAYAKEQADKGVQIEGRKLVQKKSNRKWIDEAKVIKKLSPKYGTEIHAPSKLKTPAQMEKVVGKEIVADLCEKPDVGTTLVAITDKRPAIGPAIGMDFDPVQ